MVPLHKNYTLIIKQTAYIPSHYIFFRYYYLARTNLAYGKPTEQISTYLGYDGSRAVDGDRNGNLK